MSNFKSTTSSADKYMKDDLSFFGALGAAITLPVTTSVKAGVTGLIMTEAAADAVYKNRKQLSDNIRLGVSETITLMDNGVVAVAMLNGEISKAMGVNPKDDLETKLASVKERYSKEFEKKEEN